MEIDLTEISEVDWKILCQLKKASLGCWKAPLGVSSLLTQSRRLSKRYRLDALYQQVTQWVRRRCIQLYDVSYEIAKAHMLDQKEALGIWLALYFHWDKKGDWYSEIPQSYRYEKLSWWQNMWHGAWLFSFWKNSMLLLNYYALVYELEHAVLEDIPKIWQMYKDVYQKLDEALSTLYKRSYWWHWVLRGCIEKTKDNLDTEYQVIVDKLKKRLLIKENAFVLLTLLAEASFYDLLQVLQGVELDKIMEDWQLHYPKWRVIYKIRSKQSLNREEKVIGSQFWKMYGMQAMQNFQNDGYRSGRLMERLLEKGDLWVVMWARGLLDETICQYTDFWYQFRDFAMYFGHREVACYIDEAFLGFQYRDAELQTLSLDKVKVSKLRGDQYKQIVFQYNQSLSSNTVKRFKLLLSDLCSLVRMDIGFKKLRQAQIMWRSVDQMFATNMDLKSLRLCLNRHGYLTSEQKVALQAYMITLGRYIWIRLGVQKIRQNMRDLKSIELPVWQDGLALLERDIDQLEERSKYDI